jgi:hypothetical protein
MIMPRRGASLKHWGVRHNLAEAAEAIGVVVDDIARGVHDHDGSQVTMAGDFAHIVAHLNHAWCAVWISNTEYETVGDRDLHRINAQVPNFGGAWQLVEADRPEQWQAWGVVVPEQEVINHAVTLGELRVAGALIGRLIDHIDESADAAPDRAELANLFEHMLGHLCIAWHIKWMSDQQILRIDLATRNQMAHCLPRFDPAYTLIDLSSPKSPHAAKPQNNTAAR